MGNSKANGDADTTEPLRVVKSSKEESDDRALARAVLLNHLARLAYRNWNGLDVVERLLLRATP